MLIVIILVVVLGVFGFISRFWTEYLWYEEVAYTTVFWTPLVAKLCVGLFFAVIFFGIFYGSLWLARKISPGFWPCRERKTARSSIWPSAAAGRDG